MFMRGGIKAALLLAVIVSFCFSISLSGTTRGSTEPVGDRADDGRWNVELRLMCQPNERPDPTLHRPRPPEADELKVTAEPEDQLAAHVVTTIDPRRAQ